MKIYFIDGDVTKITIQEPHRYNILHNGYTYDVSWIYKYKFEPIIYIVNNPLLLDAALEAGLTLEDLFLYDFVKQKFVPLPSFETIPSSICKLWLDGTFENTKNKTYDNSERSKRIVLETDSK